MYRQCVSPPCVHYALHVVTVRKLGLDIRCCNGHLELLLLALERVCPRTHITVATSSAVVVGDVRAWRTRSAIAYDVSRQIGA